MTPTTKRMWPRGRTGAATIAALCALALSAGGAYALRIVEVNGRTQSRAPQPSLIDTPSKHTDLRWALFTFSDRNTSGEFQCSLDGTSYHVCPKRVVYGLIEGTANATLGCVAGPRNAHGSNQAAGRRRPAARRCQSSQGRRLSHVGLHSNASGQGHRARTLARVCGQQSAGRRLHNGTWSSPAHRGCKTGYVEGVGRLLALGEHTFRVRFQSRSGALSKPTTYSWAILTQAQLEAFERGSGGATGTSGSTTASGSGSGGTTGSTGSTGTGGGGGGPTPIVRTKSFVISGQPEGTLYPGGPALTIPLKLFNPNPLPIYVTALEVSVASSPAGCSAEDNLRLTQSSVSGPIAVPAGSSVTLPTQGATAPTIQFLNLPVNQNACEGAVFPLSYSGSAHS
jgi:hypothetical protein